MTPSQSPIAHSPSGDSSSPEPRSKDAEHPNTLRRRPSNDCKKILDNMLFKISGQEPGCESENSFQHTNNNDMSASNNNNNNNSNKTDEEEKAKYLDCTDDEDIEAIRHGEKFLQWLENCSNPRVTAVQLMQLRFLIAAIKSGNESSPGLLEKSCSKSLPETEAGEEIKDSKDMAEVEEGSGRGKSRRRK